MKSLYRIFAFGLLAAAPQLCNAWGSCTPIVIDLSDGIDLEVAGWVSISDMNADGFAIICSGCGVAIRGLPRLRRSGNGVVDDGAELFGVGTMELEGRSARRCGFDGPGAATTRGGLGGDDDGLDHRRPDAIWRRLQPLGGSRTRDGVAARAEQCARWRRISGITRALKRIQKVRKCVDAAGNVIPYWAWAQQRARPGRGVMVERILCRALRGLGQAGARAPRADATSSLRNMLAHLRLDGVRRDAAASLATCASVRPSPQKSANANCSAASQNPRRPQADAAHG